MYWDASKPTRNGFVHLLRETQMPTEGTGFYSPYPEDKPMAQVTYRGVSYDSEEYRKLILDEARKKNNHDLMYRGVKVTKKLVAA